MDITKKDFEELCQVDKYNLDSELENYLSLVGYCLKDFEKIKNNVEKKKYELELLYGVLDNEIRVSAEREKKKITEKTIENKIRTDQRYQDAYIEYLEAKKQMGNISTLLEVLRRRKFVIEELIHLYTTEYFGIRIKKGDRAKEASLKEKYKKVKKERRKENGI